jgi:CRISPR system Cascade subunit CasC
VPRENATPDEKEKYANALDDATKLARQTLRAFLMAAIFTTPTGKQNTFAAHQPPSAILIEVRPRKTPISYANAFVSPSRPHDGIDLIKDSVQKFVSYSHLITRKFNLQSSKRLWFSTVDDIQIENAEICETIESMIDSLDKSL